MRPLGALITLLVLLSAGCTGIPTAGPIEEVPVSTQPRGIDIAPQPPEAGVAPTRLVEGFLQAMAAPEGDYAVARQYLTPAAAEEWDPASATVVDATVTGDGEMASLTGQRLGTLDLHGHYTAAAAPFVHQFTLTELDGEWRIAAPPPGLLLTRYIFERYYQRVTLYYLARAGGHVVPDPIHLPETRVTPEAIVEALLAGPSPTVAQAVSNALPNGVRLGAAGASLNSDGVVTVDLAGLSERLGDDARRRLGAQLMWSLTAIPRATGLVVTNDGVPFILPGSRADGVLELAGQQGYQILSRAASVDLFAVDDGAPGRLTGDGQVERWRNVDLPVADIAVSLDGEAAIIDDSRTVLAVGAPLSELTRVETGYTNLRSPSFSLGVLWLLADGPSGRPVLLTVDRQRSVELVSLDLPVGLEVLEFAVSPARARIALLVGSDDTGRLGMAQVLPTTPVTVTGWAPLPMVDTSGQSLTDVSAVAWQAETSLAVAATSDGLRSVYSVEIDGSLVEELGPFSGDVAGLTANARLGGGAIATRTAAGTVWRYEARTRWTRLAEDIAAIAYAS